MGSTRLPGKVSKMLRGKPMLQWEIERLKKCKKLDGLLVATSELPADDAVAGIAKACGIECFRGSEKDVLDRYCKAATQARADVVVRITGDCPLHDPAVVDEVIIHFQETGVAYLVQPQNYPEGVDTEIFTNDALQRAGKEARLPSEREHVTQYFRNHPEIFKIDTNWRVGNDDDSSMHWSVDTAADFQFAEEVFKHFGEKEFGFRAVLALVKARPELLEINKGGTGFEGLAKSLKEDEEYKKQYDL